MHHSNMFKLSLILLLTCSACNFPMRFATGYQHFNFPANNEPIKILLSIANQTEHTIYAFIPTTGNATLYNSAAITSLEDKDNIIPKASNVTINTQLGMFTLYPDNLKNPKFLILSHQTLGPEGQKIITQIPYDEVNNIVLIVNPDGSVSFSQAIPESARQKMNAITNINNGSSSNFATGGNQLPFKSSPGYNGGAFRF